ncbi:hypothetical protein PM116P2_00043 [Parabacteroides phage PM116P2]|nr:hypothetical protein PM116P1_00041 [Parabacteroides phage PM116P1]WAX17462.1 hypothetical protein PM116P2_00043 [Parabacteroides phage PM116P2]
MELRVYINNLDVEGIDAKSFKLTINNADPLKFTERSVAYSGNLKAPHTDQNDRIFSNELSGGMFGRSKPYIATVMLDGLPLPINDGRFRVQVTASDEGYTLNVVETFVKVADLPKDFGDMNRQATTLGNQTYYRVRLRDMLEKKYGTVVIPAIAADGVADATHVLYGDIREMDAETYKGGNFYMVFQNSYNTAEGAVFPSPNIVPTVDEIACMLANSQATVLLGISAGSFIRVRTSESVLYLHPIFTTGAGAPYHDVATAVRTIDYPDGTARFEISSTATIRTAGNLSHFVISTSNTYTTAQANALRPTDLYVAAEGSMIGMQIKNVTNSESQAKFVAGVDIGMKDTYELVQNLCKLYLWKYDYNYNTRTLTFSQAIDKTKRIDWSGRMTGKPTHSETAGIAKNVSFSSGDYAINIPVYGGAFNTDAEGVVSAFPISANRTAKPQYALSGGNNFAPPPESNYFYNASGFYTRTTAYYKMFDQGIQSSFNAKLSYWDIQNFQADAVYWFDNLNGWYYLRSISNWSAADGSCQIVAIRITI